MTAPRRTPTPGSGARPAIARSRVVLPEPFGPVRASRSGPRTMSSARTRAAAGAEVATGAEVEVREVKEAEEVEEVEEVEEAVEVKEAMEVGEAVEVDAAARAAGCQWAPARPVTVRTVRPAG